MTLSDPQLQRIAEAVSARLTPAPSSPPDTTTAPHPAAESLQRGIRKLQADIRARADQALEAHRPPERQHPPATSATQFRWHILSTGIPRASAALVEHLQNPTMDVPHCTITTPITIRFAYRWVRAQYASDDHGALTATAQGDPSPAATCVLKYLATTGLLGRKNHGTARWFLEARLSSSQELSQ